MCDGSGTHTPRAINTLNATTLGKIALVDFFHHFGLQRFWLVASKLVTGSDNHGVGPRREMRVRSERCGADRTACGNSCPMVHLATKILMDDKTRFATTVSGVAFSVMLVIVQVGIFLGMLENASITIERMEADLWVTAKNTPNIDFANTFPELYVHRVRSVPGVLRADNLIVWFVTVALPNGAKEATIVYALEDFRRWKFPWNVVSGNPLDLRRGRYVFIDESAARRFGPFAVGDYREFLGLRLKIIGRTREARSFTTNPLAFLDYRVAQGG